MSERDKPVYVRIGEDRGQVLVLFTKDPEGGIPANISKWYVDPKECVDIAEALTSKAFEADTNIKPVGETLKASLVDKHRERLLPLLAHVIRSLLDQKKSPGQIAVACLDEMCKEVF